MRKIIIFSLIFSLFFTNLDAQIPVATKKQILDFYKSTTLVVLDGGLFSEYNAEIQEVMEKYWTATPFKFISMNELDDYYHDNKYSFIMKTRIRYDAKKVADVKYNFLTLVLGHGSANDITAMPDLCSFPLSYDQGDANMYLFKLPSAIQFMQNHVALTKENEGLSGENVLKHYNKNKTAFNNKTLYVLKSDLSADVNSLSKIKKVYPGKVEIVSIEEMKRAIDQQDENIVYIHKVGPTKTSPKARCWKLVLAASDATLFSFEYHKITKKMPDGILESDFKSFKKLNK